MVLTPEQLRSLSYALEGFSKIRREHGIELGAYGCPEVTVLAADVSLRLSWDEEHGYYVDDRSGS